jgi:hypothetical protein
MSSKETCAESVEPEAIVNDMVDFTVHPSYTRGDAKLVLTQWMENSFLDPIIFFYRDDLTGFTYYANARWRERTVEE